MDTIKQRLRRHNGTDYDVVHLETDGSVVEVELQEAFTNPLNTDQLTPGQHDVYFTAYPDIKWHVDHIDGDYVYLGLYTLTESTQFGPNTAYSASTIASKCTMFLNNAIPNVADFLEEVTVEGVTNKVFIPTYYQMSGNSGYGDTSGPVFTYIANASYSERTTIISNDWTQDPPWYSVWLSSRYDFNTDWCIDHDGGFGHAAPSLTYGLRPEVKVRYKAQPITKNLNTALGDKQDKLTFDSTPTAGSTNPVTSSGVKNYVDNSYTIAGQKSGTSLGTSATAEGAGTTASGSYSHAEGYNTIASGSYSHAEGYETVASGNYSHAEGNNTAPSGDYSHTEGRGTYARGVGSHAEGLNTSASGSSSHAEGYYITANHRSQHVFGEYNIADASTAASNQRGTFVEIVGNGTSSARSNARTLDWSGNETLAGKLTLGAAPTANMDAVTKQYMDNAVQSINTALDDKQDKLTFDSTPTAGSTNPVTSGGVKSYVGGSYTIAGQLAGTSLGTNATAEGTSTTASGNYSHAEGATTTASGIGSHAEGGNTTASGLYSHAEGYNTTTSGNNGHVEGAYTTASGVDSHAEGFDTTAKHLAQHVFGAYNILDASTAAADERGTYIEIVGNGSSNNARSNARSLDWDGNETLAGKLTLGAAPTANMDAATKQYVDGSYTIAGQKSGTSLGTQATAEGNGTTASGNYSHAEGSYTTASGIGSHAEGASTAARGNYSHAEGFGPTASGEASHAEGNGTTASGARSHAEGNGTVASGEASHAEGYGTTAKYRAQHVFGEYNVLDASTAASNQRGTYVEIVGNGSAFNARSNARSLDWSGNETLAGKLTLGAAPTANMDAATKQYVDNSVTKTEISGTTILGPTLHVASSDPTASDGADGDFWFVYEE